MTAVLPAIDGFQLHMQLADLAKRRKGEFWSPGAAGWRL